MDSLFKFDIFSFRHPLGWTNTSKFRIWCFFKRWIGWTMEQFSSWNKMFAFFFLFNENILKLFLFLLLALLLGILAIDPAKRFTIKDIKQHPWVQRFLLIFFSFFFFSFLFFFFSFLFQNINLNNLLLGRIHFMVQV